MTFSTISSSTSGHHYGVTVFRDVRYSDSHERNVMDIYQPSSVEVPRDDDQYAFIYIHGGMWLRGSKDQQMLSYTDISYELANELYRSLMTTTGIQSTDDDQLKQSTKTNSFSCNVGLTMAYGKNNVYIPNYRLVGRTSHETVYPQQVYDVARAIKFSLLRELKETKNPKLWISGHSAGAHLAALVLSDDKFMNHILTETYPHEEDESYLSSDWRDMISGFIGISGPYNLQRLAMSPMADITIGPAFLGQVHTPSNSSVDGASMNPAASDNLGKSRDVKEASPIHVLLKKKTTKEQQPHIDNASQEQTRKLITTNNLPLLAQIPVLLLNAESDFHLNKDSTELIVALKQLSKDDQNAANPDSITDESNSQKKTGISRHSVEHKIIKGTNHLTIMKNFGCGFIPNVSQNEVDNTISDEKKKEPKEEAMESTFMFSQVSNLITYVGDAVYNNIMPETYTSTNDKDEVASTIFKYIKSNGHVQIKE